MIMSIPTSLAVTNSSGVCRTISAIGAADVGRYHRLGTAAQVNFGAAYLSALNHCPDFRDRVVAFHVVDQAAPVDSETKKLVDVAHYMSERTGYEYVVVSFYERRL
jgi:hypothetical protein